MRWPLPAARPAAAAEPVVLTATDAVWIEVKDGGDDPEAGRACRRAKL